MSNTAESPGIAGGLPKGNYNCALFKLGHSAWSDIEQVPHPYKTVLLLDALDEADDCYGRMKEYLHRLLRSTQSFRRVVITCRTQFFPDLEIDSFTRQGYFTLRGFVCPVKYISPFDDIKVEKYLSKRFPSKFFIFKQKKTIEKAKTVINKMGSLRCRPMLLRHISELMNASFAEPVVSEYEVYKHLVQNWLFRENHKTGLSSEHLLKACMILATELQIDSARDIQEERLNLLISTMTDLKSIKSIDVKGRSLLNRTSEGAYRFSHYSIQEFLVAYRIINDLNFEPTNPLPATPKILNFIIKNGKENTRLRLIDLVQANLSNVNITGADFSEMDLRGVNFRGAKLKNVKFVRSCLRNADLRGADLTSADLTGADLKESKFDDAKLDYANLYHARMEKTSLNKARFVNANLQHADFSSQKNLSNIDFRGSNLIGQNFTNKNLINSDFRDANITDLKFTKAKLGGVNLSGADLSNQDFENHDLKGISLIRSNLENANFRNANLENADLTGANIKGANFEECILTGANCSEIDFSYRNFRGVNFFGSIFRKTNFWGASLIGACFEQADLSNANITESDCSSADFSMANLTGLVFDKAKCTNIICNKTFPYEICEQMRSADSVKTRRFSQNR